MSQRIRFVISTVLLLYICFCNLVIMSAVIEFDFGTLTLSSLKLLGDAHLNNGSVRLTRDLSIPNFGAGRVLYSKPVRFKQPSTPFPASFSTFFSFSVSNLDPSSIGDGLAFIISLNNEIVGDAGGRVVTPPLAAIRKQQAQQAVARKADEASVLQKKEHEDRTEQSIFETISSRTNDDGKPQVRMKGDRDTNFPMRDVYVDTGQLHGG
ncbi:hypothetical protein ACLB2K_008588 [Fragaria x ananassa]